MTCLFLQYFLCARDRNVYFLGCHESLMWDI